MKSLEATITALECCAQHECCLGCPYFNAQAEADGTCIKRMGTDALLHLIRFKAKNERLEDDLK